MRKMYRTLSSNGGLFFSSKNRPSQTSSLHTRKSWQVSLLVLRGSPISAMQLIQDASSLAITLVTHKARGNLIFSGFIS